MNKFSSSPTSYIRVIGYCKPLGDRHCCSAVVCVLTNPRHVVGRREQLTGSDGANKLLQTASVGADRCSRRRHAGHDIHRLVNDNLHVSGVDTQGE